MDKQYINCDFIYIVVHIKNPLIYVLNILFHIFTRTTTATSINNLYINKYIHTKFL